VRAAALALLLACSSTYAADCVTSSGSWQSFPFPSQSSTFTLTADLIPLEPAIDSVLCLSNGVPTGASSCAVILRFANDNQIDARNGGVYVDLVGGYPYVPLISYHADLAINITTHTYTIKINGVPVTPIPLAFRSEQAAVASLDTWSVKRLSGVGLHDTCDTTLTIAPSPTSCDPCDYRYPGTALDLSGQLSLCASFTDLQTAAGLRVLAREHIGTGVGSWAGVLDLPIVKRVVGDKTTCYMYGVIIPDIPDGNVAPPIGCDHLVTLDHLPLIRWWEPTPGHLWDLALRAYNAAGEAVGPPTIGAAGVNAPCGTGEDADRFVTVCGPAVWHIPGVKPCP
jgi:hypothetical protein